MAFFNSRKTWVAAGLAAWLGLVLGGAWFMTADSLVGGVAGRPEPEWPAGSTAERNGDGHTLVVALHPECPCSRATLAQLAKIMSRGGGRLKAQVWCVQYSELADRAEASALWARAKRIPGVELHVDVDGAEARRFDLRTSGETRLYGPDGGLLFQGGITAARGHEGDNPGQTIILNLIRHGREDAETRSTPVFGCAL